MNTMELIEYQIAELEHKMLQEFDPDTLAKITTAWVSAKLAKLAVLEKLYEQEAA